MRIASHKLASVGLLDGLKLAVVLFAAIFATGCISAKSKPVDTAAAVESTGTSTTAPSSTETDSEDIETEGFTTWVVSPGEHLWGISGTEIVYGVPEQWPLLYRANRVQINDPDLIYPGQELFIPRTLSSYDVEVAIIHAKTRGAWAVGPIEESDIAYLEYSESN